MGSNNELSRLNDGMSSSVNGTNSTLGGRGLSANASDIGAGSRATFSFGISVVGGSFTGEEVGLGGGSVKVAIRLSDPEVSALVTEAGFFSQAVMEDCNIVAE